MKIIKTPLTQIKENPTNPRMISEENLQMLVNSILEFPKMLEIRPIVTDEEGLILGGNMRYKALQRIAGMEVTELRDVISGLRSVKSKDPTETEIAIADWQNWHKDPFAYIVEASTLTDAERDAFVIKDNVNFGQWDWDALENFSQDDLQDWGVQTWGTLTPLELSTGTTGTPTPPKDTHERIIVIFPRERRAEVEECLGLPSLNRSAYKAAEILKNQAEHDDRNTDV